MTQADRAGRPRAARSARSERLPTGLIVGLFAGVSWLAGCTELAPGDDRLTLQFDPNRPDSGPPPDTSWGCIGHPSPGGADRLVPTVDFALTLVDSITNGVPPGVSARACRRLDVRCETPVVDAVTPSVDGAVHLLVPQSFNGYVEITSTLGVPTMFFVNRPLMQDTADAVVLVSRLGLDGLAAQASIVLDPMNGALLIRTFDCAGAPAPDIELSTNVGGIPFVFVDGLPSVGVDVTSATGFGGFVNVPAGYAVLQGRHVTADRVIGISNVLVRPAWFTYGYIEPVR